MDPTIFSKLELECGMEKEIERLKNQIALLEKENQLLKQNEVERTKLNMKAECACIYSSGSARTCLLRNGYKFSYVSNAYNTPLEYHVENWIRGV